MFIPLVDSLRCPNAHEETWLVASIETIEDRDIKSGMLGCPQCMAEYAIRDGIVHFAEVERAAFVPPSEEDATRIAAVLDLLDPRMVAVLEGEWGAHAPLVRTLSPASLLLVNPPEGVISGDGVSIVLANRAPLAAGSADGAAASRGASPAMVTSLQASLRGGRRMAGPVSIDVPSFLTELVRDDEIWVAQLDAGSVTSAPVLLTPRSRKARQ